MDIETLQRTAQRQRGLFLRSQARACGFSADQIRHRLRHRRWQRVWGPVCAESGLWLTPELLDRAAQLGVAGSVLAGPSAARLWGMDVEPAMPHLANAGRARSGVRIVPTPVDQVDRVRMDRLFLTSRQRTVFDCLYLLAERDALDLLDRALQLGWITPAELADRCTAFVGRHGVGQVVRVMRQAAGGSRFAGERLCARLLRQAGIRGWTANATIRDLQGVLMAGDLVFAADRLVVEVDGWAYHSAPDRFQADRERQNRLVAAGWTVLRFTWRDLTERADYVIRTIRAVLETCGRSGQRPAA